MGWAQELKEWRKRDRGAARGGGPSDRRMGGGARRASPAPAARGGSEGQSRLMLLALTPSMALRSATIWEMSASAPQQWRMIMPKDEQ